MKAKELAEKLLKYPELDVWFSPDIGLGEGGQPCKEIQVDLASEVGLDGDEIDDEYFFVSDEEPDSVSLKLESGKYFFTEDKTCISKKVIILS